MGRKDILGRKNSRRKASRKGGFRYVQGMASDRGKPECRWYGVGEGVEEGRGDVQPWMALQ